jgi:hypothetical protein
MIDRPADGMRDPIVDLLEETPLEVTRPVLDDTIPSRVNRLGPVRNFSRQ